MVNDIITLLSMLVHDLASATLNVAIHAPWLYVIACTAALVALRDA